MPKSILLEQLKRWKGFGKKPNLEHLFYQFPYHEFPPRLPAFDKEIEKWVADLKKVLAADKEDREEKLLEFARKIAGYIEIEFTGNAEKSLYDLFGNDPKQVKVAVAQSFYAAIVNKFLQKQGQHANYETMKFLDVNKKNVKESIEEAIPDAKWTQEILIQKQLDYIYLLGIEEVLGKQEQRENLKKTDVLFGLYGPFYEDTRYENPHTAVDLNEAFKNLSYIKKYIPNQESSALTLAEASIAFTPTGELAIEQIVQTKNGIEIHKYIREWHTERLADFSRDYKLSDEIKDRELISIAATKTHGEYLLGTFSVRSNHDIEVLKREKNEIPIKIMHFLNRDDQFRLTEPLSFEFNPTVLKDIGELKLKYEFDFLLQNLYQMRADYLQLKRSTHKKEIDQLIKDVETIKANPDIPWDNKFKVAIGKVERSFQKELDSHTNSFFKRNNNPDDYIRYLSRKKTSHHYPRLLALVLQKSFADRIPAKKSETSIGKVMHSINTLPEHPVYEKYIPYTVSNPIGFAQFKQNLKVARQNESLLLRLYEHKQHLDASLAIVLWPQLKQYGFSNKLIEQLLANPDDPGVVKAAKKIVSDNIDMKINLLRMGFGGEENIAHQVKDLNEQKKKIFMQIENIIPNIISDIKLINEEQESIKFYSKPT